jgi:hypothetical protein
MQGSRLKFWLVAALGLGNALVVSAQELPLAVAVRPSSEQDDGPGLRTAEQSAAAGAFLRLAESATTSTHTAAVSTHATGGGGRGALLETRAEVVLMSRKGLPLRSPVGLSLIGGGSYAAGSSGFPDSSGVRAGVKLQPVFEDQLGFDGALSVAYESRGFNLVPAVSVELLLARHIGDTLLLLNLGYGAGLSEAERSGRLRAAILTPVVAKLRLGLEARGALDLERDEDEPTGEPDYDVIAGAVANYTFSHISVTAGAGPSALRFRNGRDTQVGAVAFMGLGATL